MLLHKNKLCVYKMGGRAFALPLTKYHSYSTFVVQYRFKGNTIFSNTEVLF